MGWRFIFVSLFFFLKIVFLSRNWRFISFISFLQSDLRENFSIVNVVVWDQNRRFKDIPLGKITLSKIFLAQHVGGGEQWIPLASADTEGTVTGDVQLELSYYPPTATVPMHTLNVTGFLFFSFFFFFYFFFEVFLF